MNEEFLPHSRKLSNRLDNKVREIYIFNSSAMRFIISYRVSKYAHHAPRYRYSLTQLPDFVKLVRGISRSNSDKTRASMKLLEHCVWLSLVNALFKRI